MAKDVNLIRIKADTNEYERSIKQAQKTWNDFTKGIGVNVGKLSGIGLAIGAVTTALKVAKDAFFKNEQQLDEWGRTVKSAESLYSAFLNTLNGGSISGYLQNINNIVRAARNAYDAMDELGTFNAFNQINVSKAQTNFTNAIADFREGTGSKESVQAAAASLKKELEARQKLQQNAYEAAVKKVAAEHNVSATFLQTALGGSYENYEFYKNQGLTGKEQGIVGSGRNARIGEIAVPATMAEEIGVALRKLNDTELQDLQALGAAAYKTGNEIANISKQVSRVLRGGTGTSGGSGSGNKEEEKYTPVVGSIDYQIQKVKELQEAFNQAADQGVRGTLLVQLKNASQELERMKATGVELMGRATGGLGENLGLQSGMDKMGDLNKIKIEGNDLEALQNLAKTGEDADNAWSSALQSMVFSIVAEAIATVALSFSKALSKDTKLGVFGWIAAAAAGTATMISTISAIKSATSGGFAQGGIVPGNSFSGDNLRTSDYGINSGELILNRAQQNSIASQLSNNGMGNLRLTATIKGTDIQLALNNTARQQGRGTYVTSR